MMTKTTANDPIPGGKLRLGIIGTGVAARELYLPAFRRLAGKLEVVACTNRTREKAVAFAKLAGIPHVADSAEELLELPEVEAVLVSLPINRQPEMVLKVLASGKPLASEKPVAPSVEVGRSLLAAAQQYRVPWLLAENFAFMPAIAEMQRWVEGGKLGAIRLVQATQLQNVDDTNPYFHTAWRHDPQHVGGGVTDAGVHVAHALRRICGTPQVVGNLTALFNSDLRPIDTALALLRFPSGAVGTWTSCFSAHHGSPMLRVWGSMGTAELYADSCVFHGADGSETRFETEVDSFVAQFAHFVEVVKRGAPVSYTPGEALEDLVLLQDIVG